MGAKDDMTISENTGIRIGLLVGCLGMVVWVATWGARVQTKLDALITFQTAAVAESSKMTARVEKLEQDNLLFMQVGSPALRARLEPLEKEVANLKAVGSPHVAELEKELADLRRAFDIHVIETTKKGQP